MSGKARLKEREEAESRQGGLIALRFDVVPYRFCNSLKSSLSWWTS